MPQLCFLCGETLGLDVTRDHIPPAGFFPAPRPSNLITVPCCRHCNEAASADDDAFRLWFTPAVGASPAAQQLWESSVTRGIRRPQGQGLLNQTLEMVTFGSVDTLNGPFEMNGFVFPRERTTRFIERIVKGLLTHFHRSYDYRNDRFVVKHLAITEENWQSLLPFQVQSTYEERGEGVFCCRRMVSDERHEGLWLMTFFLSTNFLVHHRSRESAPPNAT